MDIFSILLWSNNILFNQSTLKLEPEKSTSIIQVDSKERLKTDRYTNSPKPTAHRVGSPYGVASNLQTNNFHIAQKIINVYRHPSNNSETVTQAIYGEPAKILNRQGSWVKVSLPDQFNYSGWIQESALKNIPKKQNWLNLQIVSVKTAKVFTLPSLDAPVLNILPIGAVVASEQSEANSNFTAVKLVDGQKGYILSTKLVNYSKQDNFQISREQILKTARQFLGQPYLWGGMSASGVDCSGFVNTVFKINSIQLHRDADLQYFHDGISVVRSELQPGDLVFFQTYKSAPSHVGIYVGDSKFIHASSKHGVSYASLKSNYFSQRFLGGKRIIHIP